MTADQPRWPPTRHLAPNWPRTSLQLAPGHSQIGRGLAKWRQAETCRGLASDWPRTGRRLASDWPRTSLGLASDWPQTRQLASNCPRTSLGRPRTCLRLARDWPRTDLRPASDRPSEEPRTGLGMAPRQPRHTPRLLRTPGASHACHGTSTHNWAHGSGGLPPARLDGCDDIRASHCCPRQTAHSAHRIYMAHATGFLPSGSCDKVATLAAAACPLPGQQGYQRLRHSFRASLRAASEHLGQASEWSQGDLWPQTGPGTRNAGHATSILNGAHCRSGGLPPARRCMVDRINMSHHCPPRHAHSSHNMWHICDRLPS